MQKGMLLEHCFEYEIDKATKCEYIFIERSNLLSVIYYVQHHLWSTKSALTGDKKPTPVSTY